MILYVARAWAFITLVALLVADWLIWLMLRIRSDERRIRPTKRVTWPKGMKRRLMKRQDNTCAYCGRRRIARSFDIDHMIPVVRGGSNDMNNLQVLCRQCNQRKGIQTDAEFRARYARLVPATPLTPPSQPVSSAGFKAETRRTRQSADVQQFRETRFISPREKVVSGSLFLGVVTGVLLLLGLAQMGADGFVLLFPAVVLGATAGFGVWLRAYVTGAMERVDE